MTEINWDRPRPQLSDAEIAEGERSSQERLNAPDSELNAFVKSILDGELAYRINNGLPSIPNWEIRRWFGPEYVEKELEPKPYNRGERNPQVGCG